MKLQNLTRKWILFACFTIVITCFGTMQTGLLNPYRFARRLPVYLGLREDNNLTYLEANLSEIDDVSVFTANGFCELASPQKEQLVAVIRRLGPTSLKPARAFSELQFTIKGEVGMASLSLGQCSEADRKAILQVTNNVVVPAKQSDLPGMGSSGSTPHLQGAQPPPKV